MRTWWRRSWARVAHVYAEVDVDLLFDAATAGLGDLERFAEQVARWIGSPRR